MAHNPAVALFILAVYVAMMVTPLVNATESPASTTTKGYEATKEEDAAAKAPKATTKGEASAKSLDAAIKESTKDHEADTKGDALAKAPEAATKGYAKVPKAGAKEVPAEGSGAPMSWPEGGPKFVEMVIKNPFLKATPPSGSSDGLPTDPTPEGSSKSNDGLPIDPTPEGSST